MKQTNKIANLFYKKMFTLKSASLIGGQGLTTRDKGRIRL